MINYLLLIGFLSFILFSITAKYKLYKNHLYLIVSVSALILFVPGLRDIQINKYLLKYISLYLLSVIFLFLGYVFTIKYNIKSIYLVKNNKKIVSIFIILAVYFILSFFINSYQYFNSNIFSKLSIGFEHVLIQAKSIFLWDFYIVY